MRSDDILKRERYILVGINTGASSYVQYTDQYVFVHHNARHT